MKNLKICQFDLISLIHNSSNHIDIIAIIIHMITIDFMFKCIFKSLLMSANMPYDYHSREREKKNTHLEVIKMETIAYPSTLETGARIGVVFVYGISAVEYIVVCRRMNRPSFDSIPFKCTLKANLIKRDHMTCHPLRTTWQCVQMNDVLTHALTEC